MRERILHLTKDDFVVQAFRAGGKGGQKQNKTSSGCRIIHPSSGARGEARDERSFEANKKAAFLRMVKSAKFQLWLAQAHAEACGVLSPERVVEDQMQEHNLRIEVKGESGRWVGA